MAITTTTEISASTAAMIRSVSIGNFNTISAFLPSGGTPIFPSAKPSGRTFPLINLKSAVGVYRKERKERKDLKEGRLRPKADDILTVIARSAATKQSR